MSENAPEFGFALKATDGMARRGTLTTAWGEVETPVFMPVGTAATVKGMMPESVVSTGASIILANTYHLIQPPLISLPETACIRQAPWLWWHQEGSGFG